VQRPNIISQDRNIAGVWLLCRRATIISHEVSRLQCYSRLLTVDELEAIGTAGEDIAEAEVGRGGFRVEQTQVGSLKNTNRCYNWV
jgi:hypothetical protein